MGMDKKDILAILDGLEESGILGVIDTFVKATPTPADDIGLRIMLMGIKIYRDKVARDQEEDNKEKKPQG